MLVSTKSWRKENQRRQLWLNKRAAKVREVLNMRELVIEAAEEIIKEDSEKDKHKRIAMKGSINSGSLRLPELIPPFIAI